MLFEGTYENHQNKELRELSEVTCDYMLDRLQYLENPVLRLATGSTQKELYARLNENTQTIKCLLKILLHLT